MSAVPQLIQRIAADHHPTKRVKATPILASRGGLEQRRDVERWVQAAAIAVEGRGGILIMFDSDGKCPASLGPQVRSWAARVAGGLPIGVVVAHQEYEAWLLAGASALGGIAGLRRNFHPAANPESEVDPKRWLSDRMTGNDRYSPTIHQTPFTEHFNMQEARARADSFDKCYREITRLLTPQRRSAAKRARGTSTRGAASHPGSGLPSDVDPSST